MLRATQVEVFLSPADLQSALFDLAAGKAESVTVQCADGALLVVVDISLEAVRLTVPVHLKLRVRAIESAVVHFDVEWENMAAVPWALKNMALSRAFDQLPGRYDDGHYSLPVGELLEELPVQFRIEEVQIGGDGVRIRLGDVVAFPVVEGVVVEAEIVPVPSGDEHEVPEHQDFYRNLRQKVQSFADRKVPNWAKPFVPWVLAVPDFFVLMVRLARDPRVPGRAKLLAGATVLYFLSPVDLIPDLIPFMGQVDDVAVALFALETMVGSVPEQTLQGLWPGEGTVLALIQNGVSLFRNALPKRILLGIGRWLKRADKRPGR